MSSQIGYSPSLGLQASQTPKAFGQNIDRLRIGKMVVYGHSLAYGGGASDPDRDVTTHLASLLQLRELPRAVGGAILHWHQAGTTGDGGYAHVLQNELRKLRGGSTLNGAANAAQATATVVDGTQFKVNDAVHIGTGTLGATGGEVLYVIGIAGNVLTFHQNLVRTHATGEPIYCVASGYLNLNPLYLLWFGLNDLAASPITSTQAAIRRRFTDVMRLIIARCRCAEVYENDHVSCVYNGVWGGTAALTSSNSGTNVRQPTAQNASVSIHLPDNFPGGTVALGFLQGSGIVTPPIWTVYVDGIQHGTLTVLDTYAGKNKGLCYRVTGLAPGRHVIVANLTTIGAGATYFDWWGIEAPEPPLILVPGFSRPLNYNLWPAWNNSQRATTLTGDHAAGVSAFTCAATTVNAVAMVPGAMVTLDAGNANAETMEILTVPDATHFTTLTNTVRAHAGAGSIVYGMQDAAIPIMNVILRDLIAEFVDGRVVYADVESTISGVAENYFWDGAHFTDKGHAVLTKTFFDAIENSAALTPSLVANTATPTAPLPDNVHIFSSDVVNANSTWAAMPAALTEFLGLTAHRKRLDLRRAFEARFIANVVVAGFAGSALRIQYSIDAGVTWKYITRTAVYAQGTGLECLLTAVGEIDSGWQAIAAEALADDVRVRVVGIGGNAVAAPVFGNLDLYYR